MTQRPLSSAQPSRAAATCPPIAAHAYLAALSEAHPPVREQARFVIRISTPYSCACARVWSEHPVHRDDRRHALRDPLTVTRPLTRSPPSHTTSSADPVPIEAFHRRRRRTPAHPPHARATAVTASLILACPPPSPSPNRQIECLPVLHFQRTVTVTVPTSTIVRTCSVTGK